MRNRERSGRKLSGTHMQAWYKNVLSFYEANHLRSTPTALHEQIAELAQTIGFLHCAYQAQLAFPLAEPRYYLLEDFPPDLSHWLHVHQSEFAQQIQLHAGMRSIVAWKSLGLTIASWPGGYTVPFYGTTGGTGLFSVLSGRPEPRGFIIHADVWQLLTLAWVAHSTLSLAVERSLGANIEPLSARQAEILRWTGDGKTSADVSDLLGVSEDTVNFHFKGAKRKLLSATKTSTVLKAAMLGMLRYPPLMPSA